MSTQNRRNVISLNWGNVVIQSCDEKEANIGIFETGGKSAYYHVDLPDLTRQWKQKRPGHLSAVQFDCVMEAHRTAILAKIDELNKPTLAPDICPVCGTGRVMHAVVDGITELGRYCDPCFEQYLRDRYAANLPITPGWAKQLGLKVTICANCESGIPLNAESYIGGRPVCGQKCGTELLAKMPKPPERVFPPTGVVTQLPLMLVYRWPTD